MHYFQYKGRSLYAEDVPISKIAKAVGTPTYIYSKRTLKRHYNAFAEAFKNTDNMICYSIKANSNLSVLSTLAREGSGFDIVSGGELFRALKAGGEPEKIVFSGVGKRADEIEYALKSGILLFNVESPGELRLINKVAGRLKKRAGIAIRINPNIDAKTHPYISTGLKKNKFGIETKEALKQYVYARGNLRNLDLLGVDCHIGSQITELGPFIDTLKKTRTFIGKLRREGIDISYLDLGGGLGITYENEKVPHPSKYAVAAIEGTKGLDVTLIFEPGRAIAGNAGILIASVLYTKKGTKKRFVIVDAGMNDLTRPSLYGSFHGILPVKTPAKGARRTKADIVGPICESGDFLAQERMLPPFKDGDLIAIMSAGAYGFTMSSNYNSRPRAAEVMVDGKSFKVIRKRETLEDLIKNEPIPKKTPKKKKR